jgi:hypothetical protein
MCDYQKYGKKYKNSPKGKITDKKYSQSLKGKISMKKRGKKYNEKYINFIVELKINGCAMCGYNKHPSALDFHHTNPKDKLFGFAANNHRSQKDIINEVNKCILLCANCHREIEWGD